MDSVELGKKIKEARIAKRMTQSEVVGNFITRNMLSQIESGTAMPSIRTLEYLCGILDIPVNQLMVDQTEDELSLLCQVKSALRREKFAEAIELSRNYPRVLSDEFEALLAKAYLGRARQMAKQDDHKDAATLTEKAVDYAQRGIYANNALKMEAILFLNEMMEKLSSYYLKRIDKIREQKKE